MLHSRTNAISDERRLRAYQEGLSFRQFVDNAQVNQDLLRRNYEAYELTEQELAYFQSLAEPVDVLAIAHDWCGDVASNLPLVARIEQLTGKLKLHILIREPDNLDIAEAYPAQDGKLRLPTYIFFNSDGQELGTFIERPEEITQMIPAWRARFWELHPEWNWDGGTVSDIGEEGLKAWRAYMMEQRAKVRNVEKEAILRAIRAIIG